jgi:hypothetical protein
MRFIKLIILTVLLMPAIAFGQVQVVGFEIGTSTVEQVKSQLVKQTKIEDEGTNKYTGGTQFKTDGSGYDIESLNEVTYIFDQDQKLAGVIMDMGKHRFDEILGLLAAKYKVSAKQRPFVGNMFARLNAKGVTIELDAPHLGFNMQASYIRDDLYRQFHTQANQETQQKKAVEKSKF